MMIKNYLPDRYSREGCIPDRIILRCCTKNAEDCRNELSAQKKTAHFHLAADGTVTALSPLSAAANLLGPTGRDPAPGSNDLPLARRGILILTEGASPEQKEPLIRLLKRIQKEHLRIFGEVFPFCRRNLICDQTLFPAEELLEEGVYRTDPGIRFRVQTGSYALRRDAEERIRMLSDAGIAAYITEVKEA